MDHLMLARVLVIRKAIVILLILALPAVILFAAYGIFRSYFIEPADPSHSNLELFEIRENSRFKDVALALESKQFIKSQWPIRILAKIEEKDTSIKAGEYQLSAAMSPQQILGIIAEGRMFLRRFTIKEGMSVKEIGPLLEQAGIISAEEFSHALSDATLLSALNIPASSFEGYLFPETYQFPRGTKPQKIITTMNDQLNKLWEPLWDEKLSHLNLTRHQLLTLASIIEKESGNTDEQPIIASVFYNRLRVGMRLQSDPTVIYGIPNFDGNITRAHLETPTDYNTYVISGLPPGPIANPGITAIKAALNPSPTNYYYFVGNGQGRHVFSENLSDHNSAVNRFQR
jgi:UPF0755 protein